MICLRFRKGYLAEYLSLAAFMENIGTVATLAMLRFISVFVQLIVEVTN